MKIHQCLFPEERERENDNNAIGIFTFLQLTMQNDNLLNLPLQDLLFQIQY